MSRTDMHRIALLALATCTLAACGQIDKPDGSIEGKVRFIAQTADMVSGAVNGRSEVRGIEADGRTLVLKLNTGENSAGPITSEQILAAVKPEVCKNNSFADLLKEGAAIRVVLYTNDGKSLPPATITQCTSTGPA